MGKNRKNIEKYEKFRKSDYVARKSIYENGGVAKIIGGNMKNGGRYEWPKI